MRFFKKKEKQLAPSQPTARGGWWPFTVKEPFSGAWQRNIEWKRKDVLCYPAVFACTTLIASDISKLPIKLVRQDGDKIWNQVPLGKYKVLDNPNSYQNRIQFIESWILSKLIRGNTYVLKERASNGDVIKLHVLHPDLVLPLVTDSGDVFYQIGQDNLAGISPLGTTVPASEIIHDRFNCFYHPLVGLSPIYAAGLPAYMGMKILKNSAILFENGARPSGVLTVPESIKAEDAALIASQWEEKYGGNNYGRVAVLGGNVKYQPVTMTAEEAQLVQLLDLTDVRICSTYHVPPYKVGIGQAPNLNNVQALNQEYYNTALQSPIEAMELCLDKGLEIPEGTGVELDIDNLLRMDSKTQIDTLKEAVGSAIYSPNEARFVLNKPPVRGGESPMIQQQNYSLEAISKRDAQENPFNTSGSTTTNNLPESNERSIEIDGNIPQQALNGAQVTALQGIIFSVAEGNLPKDNARALILAAFPLLTPEQIEQMLANAENINIPEEDQQRNFINPKDFLTELTKGLNNGS